MSRILLYEHTAEQWAAHNHPQAKPDLPPVFVNKVLLEPLEPWSCFTSSMATSLVQ